MTAPFLFVDNRGGAGVCTAYRYVGASPAQVGSTFGVRGTSVRTQPMPRHGVRQYKGDIYALAQDGVYVKDDPTTNSGSWTLAQAFTSPRTDGTSSSGLHIVTIAGAPVLVTTFHTTTSGVWGWAKFDGSSWTTGVSADLGGSGVIVDLHEVIVYRNIVHIFGSQTSTAKPIIFDPAAETLAVVTNPFTGKYPWAACVFNDNLYAIWWNVTKATLYTFSGGAWVEVVGSASAHNIVNVTATEAKWALFTDGTNLYGMCAAADDGWKCLQWDNTLGTPTDISTTVLPASLLGSLDGGTYPGSNGTGRMIACVDQDTAPTAADTWLFQSANSVLGTPWNLWKWNGNAALITQVDTGGDVQHSIPSGAIYGGDHIWTAGELDVIITSRLAVLGGEQISFIAYGGGTGRNFKLYYTPNGEPDMQEATLKAPVTGGSATLNVGLNRVEGIAADGATVYTIVWDAPTDGISFGDRVVRTPQVFI